MVIKRVGGKSKLASWIVSKMSTCHIFVDVFGGSGAVLDEVLKWRNPQSRYVFNDLDGSIYNFFKVLMDNAEGLALMADVTPYSRKVFDEAFEALNGDNDLSDLRKALYFLVINRQSFGAKMENWSYTRGGEVNYDTWAKLPKLILETQRKWKGVFLENSDYKDLISRWDDKSTTLYLDPPYRGVEDDYYAVNKKHGFNHAKMFDVLEKVKSSYCVSYYGGASSDEDPPLFDKYKDAGCKIVRREVAKHLAGRKKKPDTVEDETETTSRKSKAIEVLIIKRNGFAGNKRMVIQNEWE